MDTFTPVGIIALSALIMGLLQLTPGVFSLFYHYTLGKSSRVKADNLTVFFIIGVEVITACLFLSINFITGILLFGNLDPEHHFVPWILAGVMVALSLASLFFYYRRGHGSKLFIPREYARGLDLNSQKVKTHSDAFLLGLLSGTCELIFTLPLYIVVSIAIAKVNFLTNIGNLLSIIFVLSPIIPIFVAYWRYRTGHNLADLMKIRVRNKLFIRLVLCVSYILIAALIIYSKVTIK